MGCFDRSASDSTGQDTTNPTSEVVPCTCATSVRIEGCRVVGINGTVTLRAVADCNCGSFHWSTRSHKVTLENEDSSEVTVRAGDQPSRGRDRETINVRWTNHGCSSIRQSVNLTVVKVTFSETNSQSYGYDNMDTPDDHTDDHVSVKRAGSTLVHTAIEGGLNGNELQFVSADDTKATIGAAPAQAAFDLTINGGDQDREQTSLIARPCPGNLEITRMYINVYKEKVVRATIAKVYDSRHNTTNLRFPRLDIPGVQTLINPKAKAAVVRYELSDHSGTGEAVDIAYDNDGNGKLTWDITGNGGTEFNAIRDNFTAAGQRIAIVRNMVSQYFLDADAAIDDTTITLRGINRNNFFTAGIGTTLGSSGNTEPVTIQSASLNSATVTLSGGLTKDHVAGEPIEFPAGGWSSDPIIVVELDDTEAVIKWVLFHETGHRPLGLTDLESVTNNMHYSRARSDPHRLRFKDEQKKREAGTECQWQLIPR